MVKDTWKPPVKGELLWQCRLPGGVCVFIEEIDVDEDEIYWVVHHPKEGLIQDPSYYYNTLEREIMRAERAARGGGEE